MSRFFTYCVAPCLVVQGFCDSSSFYPQRYEGLTIYKDSNTFPRDLLGIIAQFLPEDPIIFEAGAHYGTGTVPFAQKWPKGKVFAFEPNPHAFEILSQVTQGLSNVFIHRLALNEFKGEALLHVCYGSMGNDPVFEGASSLLKASECQAIHYQGPKVVVPCVVLDDWCAHNAIDHIDFIWLDLEGLELQILRSSPKILDSVKVIYTETNFFEFRQGTTKYHELKTFLEESGFKLLAHWYAQGLQGDAIFIKKEMFEN